MNMTKPEPLSEKQLAEIREYHLGPNKSNCCADGVALIDPCPRCGATRHDTCGGWVSKAGKHIPLLLATIDALKARQEWRPINTCIDAGRYLLLTKHGAIEMDFDPADGTGDAYYFQHLGPWYASHWMPAPTPPKDTP